MIDALTTIETGMLNATQRMHVISNNIANASTVGFKKEMLITTPFEQALNGAVLRTERPEATQVVDFGQGTLRFSGNPLDVALEQAGFLEVRGEQGPLYTRHGSLRVRADGTLTTASGLPVIGHNGEIRLSNGQPLIDQSGRIWEGDRLVDTLNVTQVGDPHTLANLGHGLYAPTATTVVTSDTNAKLRQGYLETANVVLMDEMIRMIETMRFMESSQKIVQSYDDMLDKAINVIGDL